MSEREIKLAESVRWDNQRTIVLLKSLNPSSPDDIEERDKQLQNATKLQSILDSFTSALRSQP